MKNAHFVGTGIFGVFLLIFGVALMFYGSEEIILMLLSKEMALRDGTEAMKRWKTTPQPVMFKVYMWNVTNPREVSAGEKPVLSEVGPYVYEQWLKKVNVREEPNDSLSYNLNSKILFSKNLTGSLQETDSVTIINVPLLGIILKVHEVLPDYLHSLENIWEDLFHGVKDIFMTGTVKDFLFDGIQIDCTSKDFVVTALCNNLEDNLPQTVRKVANKDFRFSFFNHKNGTSQDVMRVFRGTEHLRQLGQMFSFNNNVAMNKWKNKYCDMLNGSDGSQYPINLSPTDLVYLFQSDICRSLYARFEKEILKNDLKLLRFVNTKDLLASPEENPNNECFCIPKTRLTDIVGGMMDGPTSGYEDTPPEKTCMKNGAMLLTPCVGAPLVMTFPHFYMADKSYVDYSQMKPVKELHETFVDVEPVSGIPIEAKKRVQFNIEVKHIEEIEMMANLTPGLFPVLWVEEGIELSQENIQKLKSSMMYIEWVPKVAYGVAGLGAVTLVLVFLRYAKKNGTFCWESDFDMEEAQETERNDLGISSITSSQFKLPRQDGNWGAIIQKKNRFNQRGSRVYPKQPLGITHYYPENFM